MPLVSIPDASPLIDSRPELVVVAALFRLTSPEVVVVAAGVFAPEVVVGAVVDAKLATLDVAIS
ncbi:MAG: hypothetical protein HY098_05350 [Nitrospinae bacterium]|nr:hypothetical protein [Nitrospinota bacterium]